MIWLTLRQFRVQAAVVFGGLAVLAAALLITGPGLEDDYNSGIAACGAAGDCSRFYRSFFIDHQYYFGGLLAVVVFLPGIIGVFWGAPLITRELEHGTHRLVWNQSITRTRWLAAKLGLVGLAAVAAAAVSVVAVEWWSDPIDETAVNATTINGIARVTPLVFAARGIAPLGYAAFAFALGVTVGVLVRRTLPAMTITLVVFAAVQILMPLFVRPHLVSPVSRTVEITADNHGDFMLDHASGEPRLQVEVDPERGAWTITNNTVDRSGNTVSEIGLPKSAGSPCDPPGPDQQGGPPTGPPQKCFDYIKEQGYRQKVVYHPDSHFWALQRAETGLFAVLALGLTGFCFYWTRRRLS
ncbi:ABC transporter permease [Actinomadura sp. KC216]|uniref:ABC transporter permease subunit n=1 Tax=Actinomadura sp. KC216 TaxID=2530370 RepID=UPI00104A2106|nr:ABC transporter permease subunit [Actinomadura sp. KC216]TDB84426.1 ABC transporter permease [Actinomadura sp. KC216]